MGESNGGEDKKVSARRKEGDTEGRDGMWGRRPSTQGGRRWKGKGLNYCLPLADPCEKRGGVAFANPC